MSCYHPVTAWYSQQRTPSGKRKLIFTPRGAFGDAIQISCGKCIGCRSARAQEWAVRLTHEAKCHVESAFLTLTYSDEKLPVTGSLNHRDVQHFLMRLRSRYPARRLRFFCAGEYGTRTERAHYHLLLFGIAFLDDRRPWRKGKRGDQIYRSATLDALWGLGQAEFGTVGPGAATYTASYCVDKLTGELGRQHYGDRRPPYMTCSRGIGRSHFDRYRSDFYPSDFVVIDGQKKRMPRYYDKLIPEDDLAAVKAERIEAARKHWRDQSPDRLAVREEVHNARVNLFKDRNVT